MQQICTYPYVIYIQGESKNVICSAWKKLYLFCATLLYVVFSIFAENLQNYNKKIHNFLFWSNFYGKLVFQWFLSFQLNNVYLIVQNIQKKGTTEFKYFSLKIRPELKIANFLITILRYFCGKNSINFVTARQNKALRVYKLFYPF